MSTSEPTVYVLDDDAAVRKALGRLIAAEGHRVAVFDSAAAFLHQADLDGAPACLVLDLCIPDTDGIAVQRELKGEIPIVFLTGHADVLSTVTAMKAGAVDFLEKPVLDDVLLAAIDRACEIAVLAHRQRREMAILRDHLARLTPREREVMAWVVTGRLNKQVASELGTVEKTIKAHRARVMQKMEVSSLADLVRIADKVGMLPEMSAPHVSPRTPPHSARQPDSR